MIVVRKLHHCYISPRQDSLQRSGQETASLEPSPNGAVILPGLPVPNTRRHHPPSDLFDVQHSSAKKAEYSAQSEADYGTHAEAKGVQMRLDHVPTFKLRKNAQLLVQTLKADPGNAKASNLFQSIKDEMKRRRKRLPTGCNLKGVQHDRA